MQWAFIDTGPEKKSYSMKIRQSLTLSLSYIWLKWFECKLLPELLKCLHFSHQPPGRKPGSGSLSSLGRPRWDAFKIPSSAKGLLHFPTMAPNGAGQVEQHSKSLCGWVVGPCRKTTDICLQKNYLFYLFKLHLSKACTRRFGFFFTFSKQCEKKNWEKALIFDFGLWLYMTYNEFYPNIFFWPQKPPLPSFPAGTHNKIGICQNFLTWPYKTTLKMHFQPLHNEVKSVLGIKESYSMEKKN